MFAFAGSSGGQSGFRVKRGTGKVSFPVFACAVVGNRGSERGCEEPNAPQRVPRDVTLMNGESY